MKEAITDVMHESQERSLIAVAKVFEERSRWEFITYHEAARILRTTAERLYTERKRKADVPK